MVYPHTFDKLHIGPSSLPAEVDRDATPTEVIDFCVEQGWDTMELSFVQQVYLKRSQADELAEHIKQNNFPISCHGSYYINLASEEKAKIGASRGRIEQAAERIFQAGGHSVVYHSAFLTGRDTGEVTQMVIEQTKKVEEVLASKNVKVWLRPELTGKPVQHGSLDELIKLANACETVLPCIDWSHQHARTNGAWNSYDEWCEMLDRMERGIKNKNVLQRMHMHVSGIDYGPRGEKKHLPMQESDLRYKELMQALKQAGVCGTLVCEAPRQSLVVDLNLLRDAWEAA
jgi:deoxyribonuclease-4